MQFEARFSGKIWIRIIASAPPPPPPQPHGFLTEAF